MSAQQRSPLPSIHQIRDGMGLSQTGDLSASWQICKANKITVAACIEHGLCVHICNHYILFGFFLSHYLGGGTVDCVNEYIFQ